MQNYRLFSLVAIVLLALAGGAASFITTDGPTKAISQEAVVTAASATTTTASAQCAQVCGDGPCVPCTPEQCAERCGVDIETAEACLKTAACQSGVAGQTTAVSSTEKACGMATSEAGKCGSGSGCARRSI